MSDNQKQEELFFEKKWYLLFKSNLAVILLIPTLIGGIWQVMSLLNLGFEYIRFFSVSQLVADGLVMLLVIPLLSVFPIIGYIAITSIFKKILKKKKGKHSFFKELKVLLISLIILSFLVYEYYIMPSSYFDKANLIILLGVFAICIPFIKNCFIVGQKIEERFNAYIRFCEKKYKSFKHKIYIQVIILLRLIIGLFWVVSMVLSVLLLLQVFIHIVDRLGNYFVSDNLSNTKNIESVISNQYGLSSEDYNIKYFNDSYIFVEHVTVSEEERKKLIQEEKEVPTEIIILKFDTLFEENK